MHRRENYRGGAFVGEHGSWDRPRFNGYKVLFVPFSGGLSERQSRGQLTRSSARLQKPVR
jgi:glucose/arabinose dehydrogenase